MPIKLLRGVCVLGGISVLKSFFSVGGGGGGGGLVPYFLGGTSKNHPVE